MGAMIRHIAMLTLRPDTPGDHVDRLVAELRALPSLIPEIDDYEVGVDLGLAEGNATVAVVARFRDTDDWATYRTHPEHVRVIEELILPALDQRSGIQYEL